MEMNLTITEAAGVIILFEEKVLLLLRSEKDSYPLTWGLPAGGIEKYEMPLKTAIRETQEETGIQLEKTMLNNYKKYTFQRAKNSLFYFHSFQTSLETMPKVKIDQSEHIDFKWFTKGEVLKTHNLIADLEFVLRDQKFLESV
jgi:8-oxo-dGTP pyrophosphatase MutT (NUDIX family)